MSGMPGMGVSPVQGGLGFDYRLGMGMPDMWTRLLERKRDEDWSVHDIFSQLRSRRNDIQTVAYAESHDQALVGDKCISFRLMDKDMYSAMTRGTQNLVVERGVALHKLIRLMTCSIGGNAYLNFMGNEFGHPEWIDFPREGNDWSYQYARRQWHLVDDPTLRYRCLAQFDRDMLRVCKPLLAGHNAESLAEHVDGQWVAYRSGPAVFVINLNGTQSFADLSIPVPESVSYRLELCSDDAIYDGLARVEPNTVYPYHDETASVRVYVPTRTAIVLSPIPQS
jgi:1,4-alpha-glucan branching enzyme